MPGLQKELQRMTETPSEGANRGSDRIAKDPFVDMEVLIKAAASEHDIGPEDLSSVLPARATKKSTVARLHPDTNVSMVACPYLGIFDDANTRFLEPEPAHHCFAGRRSRPIMLAYQQEFCLTPSYRSCEIYVSTRVNALDTPASEAKRPSLWQRLFRKKR